MYDCNTNFAELLFLDKYRNIIFIVPIKIAS